jgi:hypothetical protein
MINNRLIFGILLLLLPCLFGCSDAVAVKGKVTFADGEPLEIGKVVFENDTKTFTGKIQKDGTFSMGQLKEGQGIPPGKYRVYVSEAFLEEITDGVPFPKITHLIAEKYRSPQTSGLEYDIQKKTTDISITIEKP